MTSSFASDVSLRDLAEVKNGMRSYQEKIAQSTRDLDDIVQRTNTQIVSIDEQEVQTERDIQKIDQDTFKAKKKQVCLATIIGIATFVFYKYFCLK